MTFPSTNARGVACYLEFRRGDTTQQFLITPEMFDTSALELTPLVVWQRTISKSNKQRMWRPRVSSHSSGRTHGPDGIAQVGSPATAVQEAEYLLGDAAVLLTAVSEGGYTLYRHPLAVEISHRERTQLGTSGGPGKPDSLMARMERVRLAQGWPADLVYENHPNDVLPEDTKQLAYPEGVPTWQRATSVASTPGWVEKFPLAMGALLAVAASGVFPEAVQGLEPYANEKSAVQGRSTEGDPEPEMDVPIDNFYTRPNGQKYYSRKWGSYEDVGVLRTARTKRHYILLKGEPGCGKTALCEGAFGEELVTLVGSSDTELGDFLGGWVKTPGGDFHWVDGPLVTAMEEGRPFLVDEIGLIDAKMMSGLYGIMDGRDELMITANPERGTVKAADGFYVIAATNPNAPGVVLSEALLSRFTLQVEMTTDWDLASKVGVPDRAVQAAVNLDRKRKTKLVSWAPQFRELLAFRDITNDFSLEFAIQNLIATAPEIDQDLVLEVIKTTFGDGFKGARI